MAALMTVAQLKAKGAVFVAEWHDGWQLFAHPVANAAGWKGLILRRSGRKRKGSFRSAHLSWNGDRLAVSSKNEGIPEALRIWVVDMMRGQA